MLLQYLMYGCIEYHGLTNFDMTVSNCMKWIGWMEILVWWVRRILALPDVGQIGHQRTDHARTLIGHQRNCHIGTLIENLRNGHKETQLERQRTSYIRADSETTKVALVILG